MNQVRTRNEYAPEMATTLRVNLGCGQTPTPGWVNLDNSTTVRLASWPLAYRAVRHLLPTIQRAFADVAAQNGIRHARAGRLPFADGSVEVLYSSHMLEHLDQREGRTFLREARRVLRPGGVLRIAVPDLKAIVDEYLRSGDADGFMTSTLLSVERPVGLKARVRQALVGFRDHRWLYDGKSLVGALLEAGFVDAVVLPPGETTIADPGQLDLWERAAESVYVEGRS